VRWCPLSSSENVWHVLEVHPSSPAEIAGFIPFSDYIIGSPEGRLQSESALGEMVDQVSRSLTHSKHSSFGGPYGSGFTIQLMILFESLPLFLIEDGEVKEPLVSILDSDCCIVYQWYQQKMLCLIQKFLCKLLLSSHSRQRLRLLKRSQDLQLSVSRVISQDRPTVDGGQVTLGSKQERKSLELKIS